MRRDQPHTMTAAGQFPRPMIGTGALRANKRETTTRLKFTLEGAGERTDGHALTDAAFA
jgi:hypothetical protein